MEVIKIEQVSSSNADSCLCDAVERLLSPGAPLARVRIKFQTSYKGLPGE